MPHGGGLKCRRPLADRGIATVAVPLSSCGETGDELGDLYADVDACRHAITAAEGPVVLCGHSYGGMIITEAGAADRVTQLLYVASVMPDAGQSQADLIGSEPAPWLQPGDDGTVGVDPDMIREFFLQDCDEVTTEQALDRLTRQSLTPFTQPPRQVAWQEKPATYFVCTEDLATPAEVQRQRVRAGTRLRRVQRWAPPVSFTPGRVRAKHRRRDRPPLICASPLIPCGACQNGATLSTSTDASPAHDVVPDCSR